MLHRKPSTEDCGSAVGERESYYLLGTNALNFRTTFTQVQQMSEGNWMHGITANVEPSFRTMNEQKVKITTPDAVYFERGTGSFKTTEYRFSEAFRKMLT